MASSGCAAAGKERRALPDGAWLLYEMLTGSLPFAAQHSFDFMAAHVREEPQPIQALRPELAPEVAELVHGMLLKDPIERPSMSTVVALIEELAAAVPGLHIDVPAPAPRPRLSRDAIPRLSRDALVRSTPSGSHDAAGVPGGASLALGATFPGLVSASSATEPIELGATVAARSPARLSRDAIERGQPGLALSSQSGRSRDALSLPQQPAPEPTPPAQPPQPARRPRAVLLGGLALLVLLVLLPVAWLAARRVPGTATPAVERTVRWAVVSKPAGAEVVRSDGQVLGSTPWQVTRPADPGETVITLRHPGFQDKRLLLSHATDVSTEVALVPAPPVATPPVVAGPTAPAEPSAPAEAAEPRRGGKRKSGKASPRNKKKDQDVELLID